MQDFAALQRLSTCFNGSVLNYSDIKNSIALITGGENFKNVTDFDKQIVYTGIIDPAHLLSPNLLLFLSLLLLFRQFISNTGQILQKNQ